MHTHLPLMVAKKKSESTHETMQLGVRIEIEYHCILSTIGTWSCAPSLCRGWLYFVIYPLLSKLHHSENLCSFNFRIRIFLFTCFPALFRYVTPAYIKHMYIKRQIPQKNKFISYHDFSSFLDASVDTLPSLAFNKNDTGAV